MAKTTESPVAAERTESPPIIPTFWVGRPFDSMLKWAEEVDRLFENFGWGRYRYPSAFRAELEETNWSPAVEVYEKRGYFVVRAELPGLMKENIHVDLEDEMLILRGERKYEKEETKERIYRSERSYGSFYRAIRLPEGVKTEHAKATFKDGVLEITMPAPPVVEKRLRHLEIDAPVKAGKVAA